MSEMGALAAKLRGEFEEARKARRSYEMRWIRALRAYRGAYEPEVLSALGATQSKVFLKATKIKCDAIVARLFGLLFPSSGQKNWGLSPTPNPRVGLDKVKARVAEKAMRGEIDPMQMSNNALIAIVREVAAEAMLLMERDMEDQLCETQNRPSYRRASKRVLTYAVRLGTGALKGPLTEERRAVAAMVSNAGDWEVNTGEPELWPFFESVSIWSLYPDPAATTKEELRYLYQEHLMKSSELVALTKQPGFDAKAILEYMKAHPDGDAKAEQHETEIRSVNTDETYALDLKGRFRVLERWGYMSGRELADAGVAVNPEQLELTVPACVWIVGDTMVYAKLNPLPGVEIPYNFYYYHKDNTSFWGEGVATIMADGQAAINAAIRAMLDNAAIGSGPQVAVNTRAMTSGMDPTSMRPWKVWMFDKADDVRAAMQVFEVPVVTQDLKDLMTIFNNYIDDVTLPRYMYGDNKVTGAGTTASGLSMLMGAASIPVQDLVQQYDDMITLPFITAMYLWNIQFSENEPAKGDYAVKALGTSALIAKELRSQQIVNVLSVTDSPRFAGMIKDRDFLMQAFRDIDMPDVLVRTEEEYDAYQQRQAMMQAKAQMDAAAAVIVEKATAAGMDPAAAIQLLVQVLAGGVQRSQMATQQAAQALPQ